MDSKIYFLLGLLLVVAVVDISESGPPCAAVLCPAIACGDGSITVKRKCCNVCIYPRKNGESCGGGPDEVCAEGLTCCNGVCGTPS
ncbi:serine protease HTRA3-like isoform X1 [Diabrotica virgifera virgifera]|uniref:Serine protease HTRA3-like isoform X2 n=1 Tax=Diabrotica virgifera virgifera TaxID=50390 RepID=A0A6P7F391_DIAVI|nr:serine protease HTRA3-like isoform X1 [Diabrotica virgifera virgifera]